MFAKSNTNQYSLFYKSFKSKFLTINMQQNIVRKEELISWIIRDILI